MTENWKHARAIFVALSLILAAFAAKLAAGQTRAPAHQFATDKIAVAKNYINGMVTGPKGGERVCG